VIDFEGSVPLYQQVAAILRERIEGGRYAVDRPVPSKLHLRQEFQVSQGVVEHALTLLRDAGYLKTVLGRGLYVTPRSQWKPPA